jgi:hypothetical protein
MQEGQRRFLDTYLIVRIVEVKYDYFNRYNRPAQASDTRTNLSSPCMYHPGFASPYHGTTGTVDRGPYHGHYVRPPTLPPYLPSNSNMLRHLTSLPQRYPIRLRQKLHLLQFSFT